MNKIHRLPTADTGRQLSTVNRLVEMHRLGLLGGEIMPEDALIGVVPREPLTDVITLAMALNYQRNSYKLWEGVAQTYIALSIVGFLNPLK